VNAWDVAVDAVRAALGAGVSEFVVGGGARNAALLEALAQAETAGVARVWRHFEERSAAFFALGRCMASGAPCAVVTTSGTAAAELLPAMIEANYQARPLVALTADRPASFRGTGSPQAIDQIGLFGKYAAVSLADWDGKSPLHLNVEMDEAFEPAPVEWRKGEWKPQRDRLDVAGLARWLRSDLFRGLVVMVGGLEPAEQ
jgi:2-succinyl-5-enolpyruvyl-6-hydroxy-3-cyclohexene-1-carboxylate synthase